MDPGHWGKHDLGERVRHLVEGKVDHEAWVPQHRSTAYRQETLLCCQSRNVWDPDLPPQSLLCTERYPSWYHYQTPRLWECLYK